MEVREARIDDVAAVVATLVMVAPEGSLGLEPPVDAEALARSMRELVDAPAPEMLWVLVDDGEVIGSAALRQRHPGVLSLAMALRPGGRGRGGGAMLMAEVLAHARSSGAHKLALEVWPDNGRAIALYARAGFQVEGVLRDHYRRRDGSLRSSLIMGRLL